MSDAPETLRNLGYHLRVMADKAIEQIDAERLLRAAEEVERADLPPALELPEIKALVDGIERLNAACDAMWNDHGRLEENPGAFGQKYRIKEVHMRAISEAQQALPAALAAIKGTPDRGKMIRPAPDQSMCGGYPTGKVDDD